MKKIYKIIFTLIIALFCSKVYALENTTEVHPITEKNVTLNVGELQFSSIEFGTIYGEESGDKYVDLYGNVYSGYNQDVYFASTVYYYDSNMKLLGSVENSQYYAAVAQTLPYDHSVKETLLLGYTADDIAYYKLKITVSSSPYNYSNEYSIDSYDMNIKVNESNIFNITEDITANFQVSKHGIFRKIPMANKITRLDGTSETNRAVIKNIEVNEKFSVYKESGYKVVKIGDPSNTLTGKKDYTLSYTYNIGKDKTDKYDELYFNIIGTEWDTSISNITFTIEMPKEFDKSKLGFSHGVLGSTDTSNITYNVNGNTITGSYNGTLNKEEGLTVRLELPEGYFKNFVHEIDIDNMTITALLISLVCLFITFLLWRKYGTHEKVIESVEFYPPEGYNSVEVAFVYKGKLYPNDITSLLIYLANKGYLTISETYEKSLFKTSNFKITKLKDYDGDKEEERLFFNTLFATSDSITDLELRDYFYVTINRIKTSIDSKENREKLFEKKSINKGKYIWFMAVLTLFLVSVQPYSVSMGGGAAVIGLLFPIIGILAVINTLTSLDGSKENKVSAIGTVFFFSLWGGIPFLFMVLPGLISDIGYLTVYLIGIISIVLMLTMNKTMKKRTPEGLEIFRKIKGFKKFLDTAEKPRLEALVNENPTYFFDILPYTYVLGVSKKWIEKFETISMQSPNWYLSPDGSAFNIVVFSTFVDRAMKTTGTAMMSSPSSSGSGSGSSGGGSSGGGSGGGGGGSW